MLTRKECQHAHYAPPGACTATRVFNLASAMSEASHVPGDPASVRDHAFIALQNAYRPHAGLMRLHSLAACGPIRAAGQDCEADALVGSGRLFGFPWHDDLWIPLFQLDRPGPTLATGPQRVVAEWGRGVDGWALARWFVRPNRRLASHSPVDYLDSHLPDVLDAAQADRAGTMD